MYKLGAIDYQIKRVQDLMKKSPTFYTSENQICGALLNAIQEIRLCLEELV